MRTRNPKPETRDGFTLIELIIAFTLLVLIVATLYGAFHLGQMAVVKSQIRSEENQRLRSVGDLLATYIRSAYPCRPSPRDASIFFSGEKNQLAFISAFSSGMGGRGFSKVIVVGAESGEEGGSLTLEEVIPLSAGCQESDGGYRNGLVLSGSIRGLQIDYLEPQGEEERWVEQWDGKEKRVLPRAVRFSFQDDKGEGVQWTFPVMMSVLAP